MKPIHFFRAGRHQSADGREIVFSEADLGKIAASYKPARHEAPIVVGHPKQDAPAYGWVSAIVRKADGLHATLRGVNPDFAEMVKREAFKKVSGSFYTPTGKGNPTPGAYYLRHIGFLGATPPAVKGLRPIEFASAEDGVVTVEFGDALQPDAGGAAARLFHRMRQWLIAEKGQAQADELLPEDEIALLQEEAPHPDALAIADAKAAAAAELSPEMQEREKRIAAREAAFAEREAEARAQADKAFVASLNKSGRLPIGLTSRADAVFAELPDDAVSFSEDGKTVQTTTRDLLKDLLSKMPLPVVLGELATGAGNPQTADFNAPDGYTADEAHLELLWQIQAYQRSTGVSFEEAALAVQGGKQVPEKAQ